MDKNAEKQTELSEYKLTGQIMMSIVLRRPIKFVPAKSVSMANNRESKKTEKRSKV